MLGLKASSEALLERSVLQAKRSAFNRVYFFWKTQLYPSGHRQSASVFRPYRVQQPDR